MILLQNSPNEPCTWKIEVLVEKDLSVIATGNLVEVETQTQVVSTCIQPSNTENDESMLQPKNASTQLKKYHFFMNVPTSPTNIGLVVGKFDLMIDQIVLPEISYYFFDSSLQPLVKETFSFINELLEFYEETLSFHFPFGSYKLVFVNDLAEDYISFSSLTIVK